MPSRLQPERKCIMIRAGLLHAAGFFNLEDMRGAVLCVFDPLLF